MKNFSEKHKPQQQESIAVAWPKRRATKARTKRSRMAEKKTALNCGTEPRKLAVLASFPTGNSGSSTTLPSGPSKRYLALQQRHAGSASVHNRPLWIVLSRLRNPNSSDHWSATTMFSPGNAETLRNDPKAFHHPSCPRPFVADKISSQDGEAIAASRFLCPRAGLLAVSPGLSVH